jgi:hypothetical protein
VTPRTPISDFGDSSMKGLKVNIRVKGIAKSCCGFDGVIVGELIVVIMVIVINKGESNNKKPFCKTVYY